MSVRDGLCLAFGTLTRIPVPPPRSVDARSARVAMLAAPIAAVPLAFGALLLMGVGSAARWPEMVTGLVVVGFLAWATRLLHADGLSDTVDGLTASYERARSLEVMRSGTSGPAGVVATIVALGIQAGMFGLASRQIETALVASACVVASRWALTLACTRPVPSARPQGLGAAVAGTVPGWAAVGTWLACAGGLWLSLFAAGAPAAAFLAPIAVMVAVAAALRVAVRRLGGITGDVLGACVELALTVSLLVALSS